MATDDGLTFERSTKVDELINHTVHQRMAMTPAGRAFIALCSCGWEAQHPSCEDNVLAIGRHMDETMPADIRASWVGVKR